MAFLNPNNLKDAKKSETNENSSDQRRTATKDVKHRFKTNISTPFDFEAKQEEEMRDTSQGHFQLKAPMV